MSDIQFPNHILPYPQIEYSEDNEFFITSTQFETNLRQRPRYNYSRNNVSVSWRFNRFEFDFFKSFVSHILLQGTEKFNISLPGLDGFPISEVSLLNGKYTVTNESFFYWRVRAVLVIENETLAEKDLTRILYELTGGTESQIICSLESLNDYIENHYGFSNLLTNCN
jgi:hypothetical protein